MPPGSLAAAFGERLRPRVVLAPYTTFKVGGPADWLLETRDSGELVRAVLLARAEGMSVTMLGGGSNVLISDRGIRGLVIRPRGGTIDQPSSGAVRADASVTLNGLVRWTMTRGLGGLEAWAGTPGTVGGAIHGNAHYAGRTIGELIVSAEVLTRDGCLEELGHPELDFGYDRSRLQTSGEILVRAVLRAEPGADPAALREVARQSLAHRKRTQPLEVASAGCAFQNPDAGDVLPAGMPRSSGALVDAAGLKGYRVGDAEVSPRHANFIVNRGAASARDVRQLIETCQQRVRDRFGVRLREEIVYLGEFDTE